MPLVDAKPDTEGLNAEQARAFDVVTDLISAGEPVVRVAGYAGTGKTHMLGPLVRWAERGGRKVFLAAPTHKAASVMRGKVGGREVKTIHSLLGLILKPDMHADTGGRILVANGGARISEGLVICDEASMVGSILEGHVGDGGGVQWVFVGDPAQLPPVGEAPSGMLDAPHVMLRRIVRQAKGSEIISLATRVRNGEWPDFRTGGAVAAVRDRGSLFAAAREAFASEAYRDDPSFARVLTYRNALRQDFNRYMHASLFGDSDPYMPGEWLVMHAPWQDDPDDPESPRLFTSQEVRIVSAETGEVRCQIWEFAVWHVTVDADGREFRLPVVQSAHEAKYQQAKDWLANEARLARIRGDEAKRQGMWERFYRLEDRFAKVDHAYAMTVHKSQGSTFAHAFVDVLDLRTAPADRQRLLYTALTRPSQTLTVVH